MNITQFIQFIYPLKDIWLIPSFGSYELSCYKHLGTGVVFVDMFSTHLSKYQGVRILDHRVRICLVW